MRALAHVNLNDNRIPLRSALQMASLTQERLVSLDLSISGPSSDFRCLINLANLHVCVWLGVSNLLSLRFKYWLVLTSCGFRSDFLKGSCFLLFRLWLGLLDMDGFNRFLFA